MRTFQAVVVAIALGSSVVAQAGPQKHVLMLSEYHSDSRIDAGREQIIRSTLATAFGPSVDYDAEYVDTVSFQDDDYVQALRAFLRIKYAHKQFDVIIAMGTSALDFVRANNKDLFGGVPVIATGVDRDVIERAADFPVTGVARRLDPRGTVDFILRLQPQITQLFVIAGGSNAAYLRNVTREQLQDRHDAPAITYLIDLPMEKLLARVEKLPPHSAIMYLPMYADGEGKRLVPTEALARIAQVADVPVYGILADHLDYGIVGGSLLDTDVMVRDVADLTVEQLRTGRDHAVPLRESQSIMPMANWRELRRWRLNESRLPAGTIVRDKEPTVWERYRYYIGGAMSLTAFQAVMIVALVAQRSRRRKAEEASRANEDALRTSYARIRQLAGRLITAKEAVRSRIASDLHDDVCQQLAVLSLNVSDLKRWGGRVQDADTQEALTVLQRRTLNLIEVIRRLSHDLHPTALRHIGLVAALEAHCFEVERRYDIQVSFRSDEDVLDLPWNTTLCLFRIAQEGLRNAAKHANARRVTVSVVRNGGDIALTMTDDGQGFDLDLARQGNSGLGLVSMEERAHLVGGTMDVATRRGTGTTITVRVPLHGVIAPEPDASVEHTQAFMDALAPVQSHGGAI